METGTDMKRTPKTLILLTLSLLGAAILLTGFRGGQAAPPTSQMPPPQPHQVIGRAKVNEIYFVPKGTRVSAWCGGVQVTDVLTFESAGESWYSLDVPADDPNTPGKDGCVSGEEISFKIASFTADQTLPWVAEGYSQLDLNAPYVRPGPHNVTGLVRVNGSFVPEGIVVSAWCGGVQYAEGAVDGQSQYSVNVPSDDLETQVKEGCNHGETIYFKIGSLTAVETLSWHGDQTSTLDLSADSEPPGNYQVYGQVRVNNEFVPQGTHISAWCDGVKFSENWTSIDAYYTLVIPGDDPFTPEIEGCGVGTPITFRIVNLDADQSRNWGEGGSYVPLDLSGQGTIGYYNYLPLILK
jgi:hypothetical protein